MPGHPLSRRIADVLNLQPDSPAIEYDGQWVSWGRVGDSGGAGGIVGRRPRGGHRDAAAQPAGPRGGLPGRAAGRRNCRRHQSFPRRRSHPGRHRRAAAAADHRRKRRPGQLVAAERRRDGVDPGRAGRAAAHAPGAARRNRCRNRRRGADADQRNDRSAQAGRPELRHAGAQRDGFRSRHRTGAHRSAARRRDRQLAAGPHRRRLPGAAMRRRGETVRPSGTIRAHRVGPSGAQRTGPARCRWCRPRCGPSCTPT